MFFRYVCVRHAKLNYKGEPAKSVMKLIVGETPLGLNGLHLSTA